jgi:hypothetical protein
MHPLWQSEDDSLRIAFSGTHLRACANIENEARGQLNLQITLTHHAHVMEKIRMTAYQCRNKRQRPRARTQYTHLPFNTQHKAESWKTAGN